MCYVQYLGRDSVEGMCQSLVEDAGVLLLPSSIYATTLTDFPRDRFRLGIGRRSPQAALEAFGNWLRGR